MPVGRPVKLIMTSEDVIHDFFVPAFRVKADVIPGPLHAASGSRRRRPGSYHLFCAEYCGTQHSGMIGRVVVHGAERVPGVAERAARPKDRSRRRAASCSAISPATPVTAPTRRAAARCSRACSARPSTLEGGGTVVVDEAYLRESILNPTAKIAAGFQPIMPTYQGLVSEEGLLELIEYVKSLSTGRRRRRSARRRRPAPGENDAVAGRGTTIAMPSNPCSSRRATT